MEKLHKGGIVTIDNDTTSQLALDFADKIIPTKRFGSKPQIILDQGNQYQIFMQANIPDGDRYITTKEGEVDLWEKSQGAIFGRREVDMDDETHIMYPSVTVGVRVTGKEPTFDPKLQQVMRDKSAQIKPALETK